MKNLLNLWLDSYYADRPQIQPPSKNIHGDYSIPRNILDAFIALYAENEALRNQPFKWQSIINGDWPSIGERVILKRNNVVQDEIFGFDIGDTDTTSDEYYWGRHNSDECYVLSDTDAWISIDTISNDLVVQASEPKSVAMLQQRIAQLETNSKLLNDRVTNALKDLETLIQDGDYQEALDMIEAQLTE